MKLDIEAIKARKDFIAHARTDIPALIAALEASEAARVKAEQERDEYRAKLMNLADAPSVKGMSWGGFNVIGDDKSIDAVQSAVHYGGQIDEYRAAFLQRKAALEAERDACNGLASQAVNDLGMARKRITVLEAERDALKENKDGAYLERNRLVAL